jgi:hypothetical protein
MTVQRSGLTRPIKIAVACQLIAFAAIGLVALDLLAHKRVEMVAGMNIWGYRGEVAHRKEPREIRFAVIGGTRAFGLGLPATWTTATVLRQEVRLATDHPGRPLRPVVALNLARVSALPDSYVSTLDRYAYLQPDFICIYDDLGVGGGPPPEQQSGVFALTGYMPILPLALREKGMAWRYGDIRAGYVRDSGVRADQPFTHRIVGDVLESSGAAAAAIDQVLARGVGTSRQSSSMFGKPTTYAQTLINAVDVALRRSHGVVLVVSPAETKRQADNLAALRPSVDQREATQRRFRFVNLNNEPTLRDSALRFDGWNYGGDATAVVAKLVAPRLIELITMPD